MTKRPRVAIRQTAAIMGRPRCFYILPHVWHVAGSVLAVLGAPEFRSSPGLASGGDALRPPDSGLRDLTGWGRWMVSRGWPVDGFWLMVSRGSFQSNLPLGCSL